MLVQGFEPTTFWPRAQFSDRQVNTAPIISSMHGPVSKIELDRMVRKHITNDMKVNPLDFCMLYSISSISNRLLPTAPALHPFSITASPALWSLPQQAVGEGRVALWTSRQLIAAPHRKTNHRSHSLTPTGNSKLAHASRSL